MSDRATSFGLKLVIIKLLKNTLSKAVYNYIIIHIMSISAALARSRTKRNHIKNFILFIFSEEQRLIL